MNQSVGIVIVKRNGFKRTFTEIKGNNNPTIKFPSQLVGPAMLTAADKDDCVNNSATMNQGIAPEMFRSKY